MNQLQRVMKIFGDRGNPIDEKVADECLRQASYQREETTDYFDFSKYTDDELYKEILTHRDDVESGFMNVESKNNDTSSEKKET